MALPYKKYYTAAERTHAAGKALKSTDKAKLSNSLGSYPHRLFDSVQEQTQNR